MDSNLRSAVFAHSSEPAWPQAELGKNKPCAKLSGAERPVPTWLLSWLLRATAGQCPTGTGNAALLTEPCPEPAPAVLPALLHNHGEQVGSAAQSCSSGHKWV